MDWGSVGVTVGCAGNPVGRGRVSAGALVAALGRGRIMEFDLLWFVAGFLAGVWGMGR